MWKQESVDADWASGRGTFDVAVTALQLGMKKW